MVGISRAQQERGERGQKPKVSYFGVRFYRVYDVPRVYQVVTRVAFYVYSNMKYNFGLHIIYRLDRCSSALASLVLLRVCPDLWRSCTVDVKKSRVGDDPSICSELPGTKYYVSRRCLFLRKCR